MIHGLYAAANGMLAVEERQAVIANNIANATSPGFKRQLAVQRGYYKSYFGETSDPKRFGFERAPGGGVKTIETFSGFENGVVTNTGNPLDVALIGPGFLTVDTPEGVMYTRSGKMSVGAEGQLVTPDGHTVLDADGEMIDVSGGAAEIDGEGNIFVGNSIRARLGIVEFEDPHALNRMGYTLYRATQDVVAAAVPAENTVVAAQSLEASNVQVPVEMASMMMALRAYSANQQVISAINETASRLIDQVGAPG